MAVSTTTPSILAITVAQTIAYITRPLMMRYPAATILKLRLALEANLTAHYAPSWVPTEPLRGSGRRCLTLSPASIPPRPIYSACVAAKVQWSEWIALLGGLEFDLFVDPGCVSVRFSQLSRQQSQIITIWSAAPAQEEAKAQVDDMSRELALQAQIRAQAAARRAPPTLAQRLLQDDEDEDELFAAIADEMREPTWMTPVLSKFPTTTTAAATTVPAADSIFTHSRSSSRSSTYSDFTFSSDSSDSGMSATTVSSAATEASKLSRRERARQARVFIDRTKKEVTNYDGGKTTVLTGGVMLGAARSAAPAPARPAAPAPARKAPAPVYVAPRPAFAPRPVFGHGATPSGSWRALRA